MGCEAGIETYILILGYVDEKDMDTAVQYGITVRCTTANRRTHQRGSRAHRQTGHRTQSWMPAWRGSASRRGCEQTVQDILACSSCRY
ncbi:MAG: hypothetical protein ACLSGI_06855 [Butyricicoccaceae bacterium]